MVTYTVLHHVAGFKERIVMVLYLWYRLRGKELRASLHVPDKHVAIHGPPWNGSFRKLVKATASEEKHGIVARTMVAERLRFS